MWSQLRSKLASTCPIHGCAITVTNTKEIYCGACRSEQLNKTIATQQFLIDQLKSALALSMTNSGWKLEDAQQHVKTEFTVERATEILENTDENKDDNTADKSS